MQGNRGIPTSGTGVVNSRYSAPLRARQSAQDPWCQAIRLIGKERVRVRKMVKALKQADSFSARLDNV